MLFDQSGNESAPSNEAVAVVNVPAAGSASESGRCGAPDRVGARFELDG